MSEVSLRPGDDGSFSVLVDEAPAGSLTLTPTGPERVELSWTIDPGSYGTRAQALQLAIAHAFEHLDAYRVEAYVAEDDGTERRTASVAGMRKEGVTRGRGGARLVLLSRLADDPGPRTRDGFIAMLNANLPTKRAIAQGLLYDEEGRLLLCELTYKQEWDLPGGVVDPDESPAHAVVRELREELGVEVRVRGLRTVNWLPAWRAWDDAIVFVFDLEPLAPDVEMTFQPTEIAAVHWCDAALVRERAATASATFLADLAEHPDTPYREAGSTPLP